MTVVGKIYREGLAKQIKEGVSNNTSVFVVGYTKLSSNALNDFRKSLKDAGADVCVSKNRIAKIALKELGYEALNDGIKGQTAFVWGSTDSVEISKVLVKFAKENQNLLLKGGLLEDKVLKESEIKRLSELPSKDVLRAQLLGVIAAPVTRLLGAMNAKTRDLLSILKQYGESKSSDK